MLRIGDTVIGGGFSGRAAEMAGLLTISGELEFYLRDKFVDPLDIGVEAIDLGETIYENLLRPIEDHGRGRLGLPPSGQQRLGIHTGEPYAITDAWSGRFEGLIYADPQRSSYPRRKGQSVKMKNAENQGYGAVIGAGLGLLLLLLLVPTVWVFLAFNNKYRQCVQLKNGLNLG